MAGITQTIPSYTGGISEQPDQLKFPGQVKSVQNAIPDIITIAKGMGNGLGIIGAVISKRSIADAFSNKMFFNTYSGNPVAVSASLGVLEVIRKENTIKNCNKMGLLFKKELDRLCVEYPSVYCNNRGVGLFRALEVEGSTHEKKIKKIERMHKKTLDYGVLIGKGSAQKNVFRIQPPMCVNKDDVQKVIDMLEDLALKELK